MWGGGDISNYTTSVVVGHSHLAVQRYRKAPYFLNATSAYVPLYFPYLANQIYQTCTPSKIDCRIVSHFQSVHFSVDHNPVMNVQEKINNYL